MKTLQETWNFIKQEFLTKKDVTKHPLSRENAYALSSIGKREGHYSDVTKRHREYLLNEIKSAASLGDKYLLIRQPSYATPTDKESTTEFLKDLGYTICFNNNDVVLISWKYSVTDFETYYNNK